MLLLAQIQNIEYLNKRLDAAVNVVLVEHLG